MAKWMSIHEPPSVGMSHDEWIVMREYHGFDEDGIGERS